MFEIMIIFFIHDGFIFHHRKRNYGFNCIIFIVVKKYVSTSLDKNDYHATSFTFSKIDYMNAKNNINNKRKM